MTIQEQIVRISRDSVFLGEGVALAQKGKSLADAERIIALDRKLRRDPQRAARRGGSRLLDM
jgi:hypothetical protein